jgi:hypothetical protein
VRYDLGPETSDLAGRWAPDLTLHTTGGPVRLAELTRTARPLLLDFTGSLAETAAPWLDRVDVITASRGEGEHTAMLLRPDCYVAWASTAGHPDQKELLTALAAWFGEPSAR